jgi:2-polyprenyl-6-methoxyphenol hydroxylase-like FAD-dependent oxidoreductase
MILIGNAAHTATPILGQGVNLALQDAVYLAPVAAAALAQGTSGPIPAAAFASFVKRRRAHKAMVTKFQRVQEASLSKKSQIGTMLRRTRLRMLDILPAKYPMLDRVMNAPHDMPAEAAYASAF